MSLFTSHFFLPLAQALPVAESSAESSSAFQQVWEFFSAGGIFMALIVTCSVVAIAVIVFKAVVMRTHLVVPRAAGETLVNSGEYVAAGTTDQFLANLSDSNSPLTRPAMVALGGGHSAQTSARSAAETIAREEVFRLQSGMPVLEVVITIAPLLGLLGTVSGLVSVFSTIGGALEGDADPTLLARGIAMALNTTVAGLAVAVPTVMAHSYFQRKIERLAARIEVILDAGISSYFAALERLEEQHKEDKEDE